MFCNRYKCLSRQNLYGKVLDRLHAKCLIEQQQFLKTDNGYGRALTGDGATIMGIKFINFLVHQLGKGVMLVNIKDCSERLAEVGTIDATFIGHNILRAIRLINS